MNETQQGLTPLQAKVAGREPVMSSVIPVDDCTGPAFEVQPEVTAPKAKETKSDE